MDDLKQTIHSLIERHGISMVLTAIHEAADENAQVVAGITGAPAARNVAGHWSLVSQYTESASVQVSEVLG